MHTNESLINHFYTSFIHKDFVGMQDCYADNASFTDPAFGTLNAGEVRAMWAMLISSSSDMRIIFDHVKADDHNGSAEWTAYYTFSGTGNKVVNKVNATFVFENGKILRHHDNFNFYKWASQALGLTGVLLGWTSFLKSKVQHTAVSKLKLYISTS